MSETTPQGWYEDGQTAGQERFWDGTQWTDQFRPIGATGEAPAAPPVAPTGQYPPTGQQPTGQYAPYQPGQAAPKGPRKKLGKGAIGGIIAGAVVVLLVVAAVVTGAVLKATVFTPQAIVKQYLEAISAGQFANALSLELVAQSGGAATDPLLNVEQGQLTTAITNIQVGEATDVGGGVKAVQYSFTLGTDNFSGSLPVQSAGTEWVMLDKWRIADASLHETAFITAPSAGDVTVGGVSLGAPPDGQLAVIAFPGVYPLAIASGSQWLQFVADGATLAVNDFGGGQSFSPEPTPALTDAVSAAAGDAAVAYVTSTNSACDGSPCWTIASGYNTTNSGCFNDDNYLMSGTYVRNPDYTIDSSGTYIVNAYVDSAGAVSGDVTLDSPVTGSSQYQYRYLSSYPWVDCEATFSFTSYYRSWTLDGDQVVISDY